MTYTGTSRPVLAAIPVVGVALRAAYSLKARFSDLSSAALPLAAAGAASVAAVAGGIALNNNSNHADRPAPAPKGVPGAPAARQ